MWMAACRRGELRVMLVKKAVIPAQAGIHVSALSLHGHGHPLSRV